MTTSLREESIRLFFLVPRDEELWAEFDPRTLRQLDLSLGDIAGRIRESSQDAPSGTIAGASEKQIRSLGLASDARAIGEIEIRSTERGEKIHLRDIARLSDNFAEDDPIGLRNGRPAIELHVQRATSADALIVAATVAAYVAEIKGTLPPSVQLETFDVQASLIRDRINLLLRNGAGGLILVLAILFIFLPARVAMWVAIGVPTALSCHFRADAGNRSDHQHAQSFRADHDAGDHRRRCHCRRRTLGRVTVPWS